MKRLLILLWTVTLLPPATPLDMTSPLDIVIAETSTVGMRSSHGPTGGALDRLHRGIDLQGPPGAIVRAVAAGRVIEVWPPPDGYYKGHPTYGGMVLIKHDPTTFTLYGHLKATHVSEGQSCYQGQPIGIQGSTGISTGDHLHLEIITAPRLQPYDPVQRLIDAMLAYYGREP